MTWTFCPLYRHSPRQRDRLCLSRCCILCHLQQGSTPQRPRALNTTVAHTLASRPSRVSAPHDGRPPKVHFRSPRLDRLVHGAHAHPVPVGPAGPARPWLPRSLLVACAPELTGPGVATPQPRPVHPVRPPRGCTPVSLTWTGWCTAPMLGPAPRDRSPYQARCAHTSAYTSLQ